MRIIFVKGLIIIQVVFGIGLCVLGLYLAKNPQVLIEWATASELDTAGFYVYRYDENNQRIRLNKELIPSSDDPLIGGSYQFTDNNVMTNQTYTYILMELTTSNSEEVIGEIEVEVSDEGNIEIIAGLVLIFSGLALSKVVRNKFIKPENT